MALPVSIGVFPSGLLLDFRRRLCLDFLLARPNSSTPVSRIAGAICGTNHSFSERWIGELTQPLLLKCCDPGTTLPSIDTIGWPTTNQSRSYIGQATRSGASPAPYWSFPLVGQGTRAAGCTSCTSPSPSHWSIWLRWRPPLSTLGQWSGETQRGYWLCDAGWLFEFAMAAR